MHYHLEGSGIFPEILVGNSVEIKLRGNTLNYDRDFSAVRLAVLSCYREQEQNQRKNSKKKACDS